jgi:hypothetical protein
VRTPVGERFAWLAVGFVLLACIAILGGLVWMRRPAVEGVLDASWTAPIASADGSPLTDLAFIAFTMALRIPRVPAVSFLRSPPRQHALFLTRRSASGSAA